MTTQRSARATAIEASLGPVVAGTAVALAAMFRQLPLGLWPTLFVVLAAVAPVLMLTVRFAARSCRHDLPARSFLIYLTSGAARLGIAYTVMLGTSLLVGIAYEIAISSYTRETVMAYAAFGGAIVGTIGWISRRLR